jgi:L-ascorbate metabolism protein UlaG (beta-lactamase superfamily)
MDIKYIGHASFFLKTKNSRVVTDPFDPKIGLKFPKIEADTVTISHGHADHNFMGQISGDPLVLDWPGEFEKQEVRITGFSSFHDKQKGAERGLNILYKIEADGISVLHCGDLGIVPDDTFLEQIGEIDVLLVPVGGVYTITAEDAVNLVKNIEPSLVIPMHYNRPELNQETFGKLAPVEDFLKKIGAEGAERTNKLSLKESDFGEGEMKVVVMEIGG